MAVVVYAMMIQWKNWRAIWILPLVYAVIAGAEAVIAGSITGGL
jgi:paraquat-inducible protein B